MARRYGAVKHVARKTARWVRSRNHQGIREFGVKVRVGRSYMSSIGYVAEACVARKGGRSAKRCEWGDGKSPTAAARKALTNLVRKLK